MSKLKHTEILKHGVKYWNEWRTQNPGIWPDLVRANLAGLDLSGVNFFTTDLREADLSNCNLRNANLSGSILIWTNLLNADLRHANLYIANLNGAKLTGARLDSAMMGVTILVNNDLRGVRGLEKVKHFDRSHIGIDTIYRSEGRIPKKFLNEVGVPDNFIEILTSLASNAKEYFSCFISYSSKDDIFVQRLYSDLQNNSVRCWFAPEDMKTGAKLRITLDEAIYLHDKLLLVLSAASVASQWVEQEVEKALEKEQRENRLVLFPVRIDNSVFDISTGWASYLKNSRHIGDFTKWKDTEAYSKSLKRLLRDLKSQEKAGV